MSARGGSVRALREEKVCVTMKFSPLLAVSRQVAVSLCLIAVGLVRAQENAPPEKHACFTWGGSIRTRYEYYNRLGTYNGDRGGEDKSEGFLRVRTRLWGQLQHRQLTAHLQLGNEFRHYFFRERMEGRRRFPDQLFVDQLWFRYEGLADWIDLKVGRQGLRDFASDRLFSEGTPVDGSRSDFFDAVRVTLNVDEQRTRQLEIIGLTIAHHDWLPTWGHQHNARGAHPPRTPYDYSGSNHRELGGILYWRDRSNRALPWESYAIWKQEDGRYSSALARETKRPRQFNTYTFGVRLLPRFSDALSGELEAAIQLGDDHLLAGMGYASLAYAWQQTPWNPTAKIGLYGLTGSSEGSRGRHTWHAVFNRSANLGDVVSSLYPNLDHNNLLYPHLALSLAAEAKCHTFDLEFGPLLAPARERDAYGHTGPLRGLLCQLIWNTDMAAFLGNERLKGLEFGTYVAVLYRENYFPEPLRQDLSSTFTVEFRYTF